MGSKKSNILENIEEMPALNSRLYAVIDHYCDKVVKRFIEMVNNKLPEDTHLYQQKFGRCFAIDKNSGKYAAVAVDDLILVLKALPELNKEWVLFGRGEMFKYIEVKDSLDCGTNSKLPDQVLISALSSVAKVQHLLAEHLERISESALSGNLSKLDTSTTNLEAVAASFREGTGDEKGTENMDKANRNKP